MMEPICVRSFNAHYIYILNQRMLCHHMSQGGEC